MDFYEIGISGSRLVGGSRGVAVFQLQLAVGIIAQKHSEHGAVRVHQGDCIGVDEQLTRMLLHWRLTWKAEETLRICGHPPNKDVLRAHVTVDEEMPPDEYLMRNQMIIRHAKNLVIAIPKEITYQQRGSGTWYTAKHAVSRKRPTTLVLRDGRVVDAKDFPMLTRRQLNEAKA